MAFKKLFLTYVILLVLANSPLFNSVWASSPLWSQTYGTKGGEIAYSVIETSDGGYALAGVTFFVDTEGKDFLLVKTDAKGNMQWNHTYGGTNNDCAYDLIQTSDGGYAIAGYTRSFGATFADFWLVKTDANGNSEWNQTYGGPENEVAHSLIETSDGGFALAGEGFFVKTNEQGNMEWNQTYPERIQSLIESSEGGYALAGGTLLVKTDSNGYMEWNRTYPEGSIEDLVATSDGGFAIAGFIKIFDTNLSDFWLVKIDATGTKEWNKTYGMVGYGHAESLIEALDAGFCFAGGNLLIKTDEHGNLEWNRTYGHGTIHSLIKTSDGGYALTGEVVSSITSSDDFWLIKTDEHGIPEFQSFLLLPLLLLVFFTAIIYKHTSLTARRQPTTTYT